MNIHSSFEQEQKEYEAFMDTTNVPPIDETQMQYLLKNPPILCEGEDACTKYYEHGDRCRCIRTVFKWNAHYEHYLNLVKAEVEHAFTDLITK